MTKGERRGMTGKIPLIQKIAWFYGISLLIIASLRFIPGVTDSHGLLFGLFHLDWLDDVIHTATGVWGIFGAWHSPAMATVYFRGIGLLYTTDAAIGLAYGQNPLHIGFWTGEPLITEAVPRILVNIPHFVGGALALYLGFYYGKKYLRKRATRKGA